MCESNIQDNIDDSPCQDRADKRPKKRFICPHCGLVQIRVRPLSSGNECNRCGKMMD